MRRKQSQYALEHSIGKYKIQNKTKKKKQSFRSEDIFINFIFILHSQSNVNFFFNGIVIEYTHFLSSSLQTLILHMCAFFLLNFHCVFSFDQSVLFVFISFVLFVTNVYINSIIPANFQFYATKNTNEYENLIACDEVKKIVSVKNI